MKESRPRILLVDDEPNQLRALGSILDARGFEAAAAQTGAEALSLAQAGSFSAAVIDLRLEDMTGLEVLRGIKVLAPDCECILLTGHATQSSAIEAIQTGVFGYFQKPVEIDQILLAVQRAVDKHCAAIALRESEEKYRGLVELSPDLIAIHSEGRICFVNKAGLQLIGAASASQVVGRPTLDFVSPAIRDRIAARILQSVQDGAVLPPLDEKFLRLDGSEVDVSVTAVPTTWQGRPALQVIARDITARKKMEGKLLNLTHSLEETNRDLQTALAREQVLAHTDPLTGINNRRRLYEIAAQKLAVALRYHQPLSAVLFDLDHFKKVNDCFGHDVGDEILKQVTAIASGELRSADVMGRYGGEEFIILLPMTTAGQSFTLSERIRTRVADLRLPGGEAGITISIGITEAALEEGETVEAVFRRADQAMYAAKQGGRNRTLIIQPAGIQP